MPQSLRALFAGQGVAGLDALPLVWEEGDKFQKAADAAKVATAKAVYPFPGWK